MKIINIVYDRNEETNKVELKTIVVFDDTVIISALTLIVMKNNKTKTIFLIYFLIIQTPSIPFPIVKTSSKNLPSL